MSRLLSYLSLPNPGIGSANALLSLPETARNGSGVSDGTLNPAGLPPEEVQGTSAEEPSVAIRGRPEPGRGVPYQVIDLTGNDRDRAIPVLKDGFEGIYRWHAKRTLGTATWVRAIILGDEVVAVSILERLDPEVGYVYYLSTGLAHRREGWGGLLLDDALDRFRRGGARVAYGAVEEDNAASIGLFRSRGFRQVERKELGFREGGLGAWGLRSRMTLVGGEVLMGLRLSLAESPATG